MRYQKPHDYSGKEAIFINVENDDTTDTYVIGDLVHWKLADDSGSFTAGNLPAFDTRGYRVEHAAVAGSTRCAGFVASLPADNNTGTNNLNATKPAVRPFELQVYGFFDGALADGAAIIAGDLLEAGAVAGSVAEQGTPAAGDGTKLVGFAMEAIADTTRGAIFIKGLL